MRINLQLQNSNFVNVDRVPTASYKSYNLTCCPISWKIMENLENEQRNLSYIFLENIL